MAKKTGSGRKLGINWRSMRVGQKHEYLGTRTGIKSQVCRANVSYAPKRFAWYHENGGYTVERVK